MKPFHYRKRIEFFETDAVGIVHFSNYFRIMEMAEHAWFRSLGTSVVHLGEDMHISWPRVKADCTFYGPLKFEDEVDVAVSMAEMRHKSMVFHHTLKRVSDGVVVAQGEIVVVCVEMTHEGMKSMPIPDFMRALIQDREDS
ncbi:MAG: acyl-CoA thioesterase [Acidobacteria bacterium]|nr:acyl-CoA thioesterase [Acidobacteriota bacterium]